MHQTSIDQVQGTFAGPQCQQSRYDQLPQEKLGESHPFGPISLTLPNDGTVNSLSRSKQRSVALSEEVSERPRS